MKVLVTGATGVVGTPAVAGLVAAGHDVTAVARTPDKARAVQDAGARPRSVDLFDPASLAAAVEGQEAVCNLATHIPPLTRAWRARAWAENDRLRRQAATALADAALAAGVGRWVQESVVFVYADGGDRWLDEGSPVDAGATLGAVLAAEAQPARLSAAGGVGVVLRFAMFYGPTSAHSRTMVAAARRHLGSALGPPDAYGSMVHAEDAGAAVAAALAVPAGTYNVVDDEPLAKADQDAALAAAVGVGRLVPAGRLLGRLGGSASAPLVRSQRVSNRRWREVSGWAPRYPSARQGWAATVAALAGT